MFTKEEGGTGISGPYSRHFHLVEERKYSVTAPHQTNPKVLSGGNSPLPPQWYPYLTQPLF